MKCKSTGRTCDGYDEISYGLDRGSGYRHTSKAVSRVLLPSNASNGASSSDQWPEKQHGHMLKDLGPLMVLPATGSAQPDAMSFFEQISIKGLNEYHHSESWRNTLMFFSQTVPSVRHAAVALALMHRSQLDRQFGQLRSSIDWSRDALLHYNHAIRSLVQQIDDTGTDSRSISLLVCYLFYCFDHLAGNDTGAIKHLRAGVDISHKIDRMMLNNDQNCDDSHLSTDGMVNRQVSRQIRRLDMQAPMMLVDWIPAGIQEATTSTFPISENGFLSLDQATDSLQGLLARAMRLFWEEQERSLPGVVPLSSLAMKQTLLEQLERWSSLFEHLLQRDFSLLLETTAYTQVTLLRLQHTIAWILLSSLGPGGEMEYDNFTPQFQQCVALAKDIVAARERISESMQPTFTPEVGIIPVLYIIGVKCRHAPIRHEVVSILRRRPMQEAVWHSTWAASVVARIMEIEEGGTGRRMEEIPVSQRVAAVSWQYVVEEHSAPRLDLMYTLCTLEGTHHDSIVL